MTYQYLFKYIIVGDSSVGKSCILSQFLEKKFRYNHEVTIGVEFGCKHIIIDGMNIKLQIWDTAGQEAFKSITRSYYRGSAGALLVFDLSKRETFDHLKDWLNSIKSSASHNTKILLVGNKCDLIKREITNEEIVEFANSNNIQYMEASAKENINIENIFINLAKNIYDSILMNNITELETHGIRLGYKTNNKKTNCC
jgi:Ras-related protein Rab-2A